MIKAGAIENFLYRSKKCFGHFLVSLEVFMRCFIFFDTVLIDYIFMKNATHFYEERFSVHRVDEMSVERVSGTATPHHFWHSLVSG